jgi:hypothetical protein
VDNKHNLVVATHTINRNDLNALGAILWKQKNLGLDTLLFWWIKATIMEIAQCINNNITTIVAHPLRQEEESVTTTRIFGSSISVQQTDDTYTCPQGEILKPRKMAQEKR